MEHYLAEKYVPAASAASLARDADLLRRLAATHERISLLQSVYLPVEEICFYLFESDSQELVAQLSSEVGVDRILPAVAS